MVKGSVSGVNKNNQFEGMSEMSIYNKFDDNSSMGSGMIRGLVIDDDSSTGGINKK